MNKKVYAAYGSNMNLEQMAHRCPAAKVVGKGIINGHRLTFRGSSRGVANIEPYKGRAVPIVLWEITEACEKALDIYEGYPSLYEKTTIEVLSNSKVQKAMVYRMAKRYADKVALPTSYYLETITTGYKDNNIDLAYLKEAHLECLKEMK